ncbi:alpha/beta fold hydrolase [Falsiroseomonas sp. HC035]|uniref:alpha/beta fold hydrolase n=1 Tax=Falsiroseomonas sp. HC035 TaxID=3390999 RepID=UPI003D31630A
MPDAKVRGVTLNYQVIGDQGPWIALTPGSRRGYAELVPMSRELARHGYRVLLHDRRNCGASDVSIDGEGSEYEIWADDLRELAQGLGATRLHVGGSSSGARLAVLFALRHRASLDALLLWRVTGGRHASEKLAARYYGDFIPLAESGGMAAVAETEHFAACIAARPSNRDRLLAMDPQRFIAVMRNWQDHFIRAANMPIIGATEEQLRAMDAPTCIIAGNDLVHSPETARKMAALLPDCTYHDDVVAQRSDEDLLVEWDRAEWKSAEPRMVRIFTGFLARHKRDAG